MESKGHLIKVTTAAVMIALTCVLTMVVRIPSPTKGYMNLGDCAVLLGGWLLGPVWGSIAGGIGSAFADLFSGYPVYIPGTLVIKALMAFAVSLVPVFFSKSSKSIRRIAFVTASIIAETVMVAGYWFYEAVVLGFGFAPAFAGVSGNIVQAAVGIIGSCFIVEILSRTDIMRIYTTNDHEKRQ